MMNHAYLLTYSEKIRITTLLILTKPLLVSAFFYAMVMGSPKNTKVVLQYLT